MRAVSACRRELSDLEARAGIAEAIKEAWEEPHTDDEYAQLRAVRVVRMPWEPPYADDEARMRERAVETAVNTCRYERTGHRIRELYFSVRDPKLRKALIRKWRREKELRLAELEQRVDDAIAGLHAARVPGPWWLWASIVGVALVALGYYVFGLVGALGGLLVGYFGGRQWEYVALRSREDAVAEAVPELSMWQDAYRYLRLNQPEIFTTREGQTGEPDPSLTGEPDPYFNSDELPDWIYEPDAE